MPLTPKQQYKAMTDAEVKHYKESYLREAVLFYYKRICAIQDMSIQDYEENAGSYE